jgi:demethylmenaquinone methyltransferase/2-methoxy-6-polyprenyl-1,4-benzoquinol methylase
MNDSAPFGSRSVPVGEKQALVDDVFHSVARRYDLMNDLMSGGLHRLWKSAMVSALNVPRPVPGKSARPWRLLDVAGGTGDIAIRVAQRSAGRAQIIVADINPSMLEVGRERAAKHQLAIEFREANAEALPFPDGHFDAYTIAFGIRNVPRIDVALGEAHRVLKHGGHFLCLEFSQVDVPMLDRIYEAYSFRAIPRLGRLVTGDAESTGTWWSPSEPSLTRSASLT